MVHSCNASGSPRGLFQQQIQHRDRLSSCMWLRHIGRTARSITAQHVHPFETEYKKQDENSDRPWFVTYHHKTPLHDLIYVFNLELAQSMKNTLLQTPIWMMVHFGTIRADSLLFKETFDSRSLRKTSSASKADNRDQCHSLHQDMVRGMPPPDTSHFHAGGDPAVSSDDTVRRLILTPNPEFTLSLREPGPVKPSISKDFVK